MLEIETPCRNPLERGVNAQLVAAGIDPSVYESRKIEYEVPARTAKYTPDWPFGNIIIEVKGNFGGTGPFIDAKEAVRNRQKMVLVAKQHPHLDIRFVFQDPNKKLYKGSPTTYAQWAEDHGFKWSKRLMPPEWIADIKREQERVKHDEPSSCTTSEAKRAPRARSPRKARLD